MVHEQDGVRVQPRRVRRRQPGRGAGLRWAVEAAARGQLEVRTETLSLQEAADAHRRIESGVTTGKLLLRVTA
ncbi:zinc-binding dehydrogenase [Kribbella sp. NBC_00889]|uniref:zinc-binding dehydrogenase n=1 Tax=Kribbella sp. NBC_00889 TaxID=2975974 RepID=UPI003870A122|nr:zinc-binding dehydrogenase [Kribbella sp. NBC_00889]